MSNNEHRKHTWHIKPKKLWPFALLLIAVIAMVMYLSQAWAALIVLGVIVAAVLLAAGWIKWHDNRNYYDNDGGESGRTPR
jgi:accessory gene regulator protein AgrB